MIGVERANHRQSTLQRLHEIRLTIGRHALHDRLAQRASRRNGWGAAALVSRSIAAVVWRRRGRSVVWMVSLSQRLAWTARFAAAVTLPCSSWMGAAMARRPSSSSWST